ncbi:ion channel [Rhodopila sp.]|uniref:ion channel n=1 Tax=Rhodopila sp. TaxID=2480087 RepID=UPI003D0C9917
MNGNKPRRPNRPIPILQGDLSLLKLGASRFDIHDPYHLAVSLSWPAFVAVLLVGWLAINLLFALLYGLSPGDIANARPGSLSDSFFFSIETLATVGYGVMAPATTYGHIVSAIEIVSGMMFTAIVTGLLFVRFSRPKAKIVYAEQAVITANNGQHTLMVRFANARVTMMTSAQARLFVLLGERTAEGGFFRRIHDLPLMQSHLPLFVMPWTLMHPIDDASPLRGISADWLEQGEVRLFLTLEARDQALATVVNDMKYYDATHIRFGMRYADSVTLGNDGQATADLSRISLLEPDLGNVQDQTRWAS